MSDLITSVECAMSGDTYRNVVLTLALLVAIASVVSARATARKKQTADAIFDSRKDDELIKGLRCAATLHAAEDKKIQTFAAPAKQDSDETKLIRYVLNHYEYVAIGIDAGIYDEEMFRRASYNTMISFYDRASPFIEAVRKASERPTLYQDFARLVERWKKNPLTVSRPPWWKRVLRIG
jgi:hypothetical protein